VTKIRAVISTQVAPNAVVRKVRNTLCSPKVPPSASESHRICIYLVVRFRSGMPATPVYVAHVCRAWQASGSLLHSTQDGRVGMPIIPSTNISCDAFQG
jgi:hypothetical protein